MGKQIYELKVQLRGITKPPVWRTLQVESDTSLYFLHAAIQGAMGWTNSHLHHFIANQKYYGIPFPDNDFHEMQDERNFTIEQFLINPKDTIIYEYDFGDSWQHTITLVGIIEPKPNVVYPQLVKGKGQCPPEDCGGVYGYMELRDILADPKHPQHKEMRRWLNMKKNETFDPERFDLKQLNLNMQEALGYARSSSGREFFS